VQLESKLVRESYESYRSLLTNQLVKSCTYRLNSRMNIIEILKDIIRRIAWRTINIPYIRGLPRGISIYHDIAVSLRKYEVRIVFDVGANVGQSAVDYLIFFQNSKIFCFEPISETYNQLCKNFRNNKRIHCFRLALGASKEKRNMLSENTSTMNRLIDEKEYISNITKQPIEQVTIITIDEFCKNNEVDHINYLKIDAEGYDLEVLKGSEKMLYDQKIDLVEVEAGMNIENNRHVPYALISEYLTKLNYHVFGIYEQIHEWPTKQPNLRRANPVFISQYMIEKYRK